jgi:hypothetical protein
LGVADKPVQAYIGEIARRIKERTKAAILHLSEKPIIKYGRGITEGASGSI